MTTVITAKLSLAVRLLDTTSGKEITESNIRFLIDGKNFIPLKKGDGLFVFVNISKEDFLMQIDAYGYDLMELEVKKEKLDQKLPMMDVFLMPSEKNRVGGEVLEVFGTLSNLEFIEAINLNRPIALFHSTIDKKDVHKLNLLGITAGRGVRLDTLKYGVISETLERYDCFTVKEQDTPTSVVLTEPLSKEHKLNDKIYRIVYGRAGPEDSFCLKVRDDSNSLPYLIHFKADGKDFFRKIDFHAESGNINLLDGASEVGNDDQKDEVENE